MPFMAWSSERRLPESNRRKRLCRPLRNHSAKAPCGARVDECSPAGARRTSAPTARTDPLRVRPPDENCGSSGARPAAPRGPTPHRWNQHRAGPRVRGPAPVRYPLRFAYGLLAAGEDLPRAGCAVVPEEEGVAQAAALARRAVAVERVRRAVRGDRRRDLEVARRPSTSRRRTPRRGGTSGSTGC